MKKTICLLLAVLMMLPLLPGCGRHILPDPQKSNPSGTNASVPVTKGDITAFRPRQIGDITRPAVEGDRARTAPYTVTDEKMETLIELLDFAITSSEVGNLLGLDLRAVADSVLEKVYSDAVVNKIVQMLYPIVEKEFQKVWVEIPDELTIPDVPTGVAVAKEADVVTQIELDDIETALTAIDFYIFPSTLARILPEKYGAVKEKLWQTTTRSAYDKATDTLTTAWTDAAILDAEGNLDLKWGVTDRESFVDAICAALSGAEPLLLALLCNTPCNKTGNVGKGTGNAYVLGGMLELDLTVNTIELVFSSSPNPGYNNTVAPIFEALGLTPPDGNTFTSARQFVTEGLLDLVDQAIEKLLAAPLDFVLGILPHVSYAIEAGLVIPLLSLLKTEINYTTNAYYTAQIAGDGVLADPYFNEEPIRINGHELVDLNELGIDISSLNGLLGLVKEKLSIWLPEIDGAALAGMGTLTWHDSYRTDHPYTGAEPGKAARIEANKADVAVFMLRYIFGALKDRTLIEKVFSLIKKDAAVPDIVFTVTDRLAAAPDACIAALTELLLPQSYPAPAAVTWRAFEAAPGKAQAMYTDYWTTAKAEYMINHLPTMIDGVLSNSDMEIAGISADSLADLIDGIVGTVCTAETLNRIAAKVSEMLGGIALPDAVTNLLQEKLGVDLSFWSGYRAEFADGDRAAFKQGVMDLVYPIRSLLDYLLMGQDITVKISDAPTATSRAIVSLPGYDAYTAAIIPLMEALGVSSPPSAYDLDGSSMRLVSYLIDTVFTVAESIKLNPFSELMTMLPNLLFFLRSGCLPDVMTHVLYAVDGLTEVARPIYKVDLSSLIDFDLRLTETDPIVLIMDLVKEKLHEALGVNVALDFTTETLYNDLCSWNTESYVSANGRTCMRVNAESVNKNDLLTVIYDFLLREILFSENTPVYLQFAKEKLGLSDFIVNYLTNVAPAIKSADETYPGAGKALVFWVFFAGDSLVGAINGGATNVFSIIAALMGSGNAEARSFASSELTKDVRNDGFASVLVSVLKPLFSR